MDRWNRVIGRLREAQVAHFVMKDPGATGPARDDAIQAYCHAMDGIFEDLSQLLESGMLLQVISGLPKRGVR